MGFIAFPKLAGEELFHIGADGNAALAEQEARAARAILDYIGANEIATDAIVLRYDHAQATVTLSGTVPDQQTREKIVLCSGNVEGVEQVEDQLLVAQGTARPFDWHTARTGDTLAEISKQIYGDASKYMAIFEANQPMLSHPDKVYLGMVLRIPPGTRKCFEPVTVWRQNRHRPTP